MLKITWELDYFIHYSLKKSLARINDKLANKKIIDGSDMGGKFIKMIGE